MSGRSLALGFALLAACGDGPQLAQIDDHPPMIAVTVESRVTLDAVMPSDLLSTASGEVWVLDGYAGRILKVGLDGAITGTIGDPDTLGRPLRLASGKDDTLWLTDPGGRILHVDGTGKLLGQIAAPPLDASTGGSGPSAPVAVAELGSTLVVSDRSGRLSWIDVASGAVGRQVLTDAEGDKLSLIAELTTTPDGRLIGVDTLLGRIQVFSPTGEPVASMGRYGAWVGYLKQPKGVVALSDGAVAVADSELGAVQVFDGKGNARGVLAVDGAPLALAHPVALERAGADELLILDAGQASLIRLKLDGGALKAALDGPPRRWLHASLAAAAVPPPVGGDRCLQCHSGVVNDSRQVWDQKLDAHPVNIKPEKEIPAYFPLSDEGQLVCTTCHSPHGSVSLEELKGASASDKESGAGLVPHEGDHSTFLRVGQADSELCVACHTDAAHEGALALLGLGGGGHPTGDALEAALSKRGVTDPTELTRGQCLSCHAVHGASGEHLTRGEADGALCVACHADQAKAGRTHPMGMSSASDAVHPERTGLPLDAEGHVSCRTCHALVEGKGGALLRAPEGKATLCASCHTAQAHDLGGGHASVRGSDGISCLGCHDPHGQGTDHALVRTSAASSTADPSGCLGCHGKGGSAARGSAAKAGVLPGVLGHPVDGKAHADGAKALTCEGCHDAHNPRTDRSVAGCESCHAEQASAAHRGGHGQASCLDCHPMHSDAPKAKVASGVNPRAATCLACHAESASNGAAPKVASFTHPAMVFAPDGSRWTPLGGLPLYAADGTQQPAGTNGALTCSSCHLTHGPDAAEPGDNLRRPGWKEACSACHGENALPLYRYFHQPARWPDVEGKE